MGLVMTNETAPASDGALSDMERAIMRVQDSRTKLAETLAKYDGLMATIQPGDEPTADQRTQLDALLAEAKREKVQHERNTDCADRHGCAVRARHSDQ